MYEQHIKSLMQNTKIIVGLTASLALTACATAPVRPGQAQPIPAERISNRELLHPMANTETVSTTFVRDSGLFGIGETIYLYIDGNEIAGFRPSEKLRLEIPIGEHLLGVQSRPNFGLEQFVETPTNFTSGNKYSFRIGIDGSKAIVQRTSAF